LTPALRASKSDLVEDLKERTTPGRRRAVRLPLRDVLVAGQVSVSLMLLVVAGLLVRTTWKAQEMDPGFNSKQNILLLDISPGLWGYDDARTQQLYSQILPRVEALPGVKRASLVQRVPLSPSGGGATQIIYFPGMDLPGTEPGVPVHYTVAGPHYFETMGTRILSGRAFTAQDTQTSPGVVMINETLARRFWPEQVSVGQHFRMGGRQGRDCEVIGVVQDGKYSDITESPDSYLFLPLSQTMAHDLTLLVKTAGDPSGLIPPIRQELHAVDKNISIITAMSLAEHMRFALFTQRAVAVLVGTLGMLGLFLAAVGLYGVVSFTMSQRTHEIGVRMALGAERGDIFQLVLGRGLRLALIGVGIGLAAALGLSRFLAGLLYGVSSADPFTFISVALLLVMISLLACYLPARRATRVDPIVALRYE
jgi:predicted permease